MVLIKTKIYIGFFALLTFAHFGYGQEWQADLGNGNYKNPILFADYSDPDVIRVGDDFYMVASSFNVMPGIPVLHSKDLVNWRIINHVYDSLPLEKYDKPAHGEGSWAPSIRYHDGKFYVYFCTPHDGLFVAITENPAEDWDLHFIEKVELWEDPSPLWDDDGNAYLVRGKLRADVLYLHKMSPDGKQIMDNGVPIFKDLEEQPVIEGPKFMKKDGYYYILAPAGGVSTGWQTVLRSKNIYGPYEDKVVLHKGNTEINGPHQGGLVELKSGEWWFVHFQDRDAYGRIVHLQPVTWKDGWPEMGEDQNSDGIGEPVATYKKPDVGKDYPVTIPQTSDEFEGNKLGLQWQWHANPSTEWYSFSEMEGSLRLYNVKNHTQYGNFWFVKNLLLQKFMSPSFTATTKVTASPELVGEKSGLVIMGEEWAFLAVEKTKNGFELGMFKGTYYQGFDKTEKISSLEIPNSSCFLRVEVDEVNNCIFYYSLDGTDYHEIGEDFKAKKGRWIGAKVGLFSINPNIKGSDGYADFEWFRVQ
jgi:beta-xylosidase